MVPPIFGLVLKAESAPNDSVTFEIRDASKVIDLVCKVIDLVSKVSKQEEMIDVENA